ncbi:hypothetical protein HETIRDRAFT_316531 [Heterobasidion irregulare TC 32-1]|uniref:Protein arginine methyltransferase NDUFAF7 n=1 Tax=Heterobasidion irregulare (strain TC 32-1) TaxID=747525 RepID=W4KC02_HETIT|nr:uncharacterized protein HETIRDRAFT_316531 [Heterobasidion irregulare TC 32-1]ETW83288.1 hypothetical protein HETIRDRAFT_316531 [Heterobasidion irregulare TC 32-1]
MSGQHVHCQKGPFRACIATRRNLSSTVNASANLVTPVEKIISDTVKANGPISFAQYIQLCLSHPTEGYYMNPLNAVFGSKGDFVTSPEISQVFGELVGIWFLSQYIETAAGKDIRLVELGPGRGTLMDDILRTLAQFPASRSVRKHVHLVETSSSLRKIQEQKLVRWDEAHNIHLSWHDSIDDIPATSGSDSYTILVAHEFFDALPMHLIEKTQKGWQEVLITSAHDSSSKTILRPLSPTLSAAPSPVSTLLGSSSTRFSSLPIGSRIEVSPAGFQISRKVGELIGGKSNIGSRGSALIIDYGADKAFGNSFRAFKDHKIVDPFHLPGKCDLTANVDFAYLKEAMSGVATVHGPLTQNAFLTRMGLDARVAALQRSAQTDERRQEIGSAAKRLVDLTGMGKEYMVLGVTSTEGQVWPFVNDESMPAIEEKKP